MGFPSPPNTLFFRPNFLNKWKTTNISPKTNPKVETIFRLAEKRPEFSEDEPVSNSSNPASWFSEPEKQKKVSFFPAHSSRPGQAPATTEGSYFSASFSQDTRAPFFWLLGFLPFFQSEQSLAIDWRKFSLGPFSIAECAKRGPANFPGSWNDPLLAAAVPCDSEWIRIRRMRPTCSIAVSSLRIETPGASIKRKRNLFESNWET